MLPGCQNASIQNMVTEKRNIAFRMNAIPSSMGDFGGNIIFKDRSPDGSTKSGFAGTCSWQEFTPMASTKPFSRQTPILF